MSKLYQQIYKEVAKVPPGKVATYGQIAEAIGRKTLARQVGYALACSQKPDLPWHRIVNRMGDISKHPNRELQQMLLEAEGVKFDANQRINMRVYRCSIGTKSRG